MLSYDNTTRECQVGSPSKKNGRSFSFRRVVLPLCRRRRAANVRRVIPSDYRGGPQRLQ